MLNQEGASSPRRQQERLQNGKEVFMERIQVFSNWNILMASSFKPIKEGGEKDCLKVTNKRDEL